MKDGDGTRYSNDDPMAGFMMLAHMMETRADRDGDYGHAVPFSDAEDFGRGARFIPSEVTLARRQGGRVNFVCQCHSSKCCWYWEFLTPYRLVSGPKGQQTTIYEPGSRIYHYSRDDEGWIRHESQENPPRCPACGNTVISGGSYDPSGKKMEWQ